MLKTFFKVKNWGKYVKTSKKPKSVKKRLKTQKHKNM